MQIFGVADKCYKIVYCKWKDLIIKISANITINVNKE